VAPETLTAPGGSRTVAAPASGAAPAGQQATGAMAGSTAPSGSLPITGGDILGLVLMGAAALAAGVVLVRRSRHTTA
jgi:LPXTG-motif cell wall-anchored protein